MLLRVIPERVPTPLPEGQCPGCGRPRLPYLPTCLCGHRFSPDLEPQALAPRGQPHARLPGSFRLAHWSDLHLGSRLQGLTVDVRLKTLFGALELLQVDHLLISGDLTRFGRREELLAARGLLEAYGWGPGRCTVLPGNHDIPRGGSSEAFCQVFEVRYPYTMALAPGVHAAVLDSNIVENRTLFERRWVYTRGRVGAAALNAVREAWHPLPEGVRLLFLHHHLARLSPESRWAVLANATFRADERLMAAVLDAEEVLALARDLSVTAVLHGHKHWYSRTGYRVGTLPLFNAGSVTRMVQPQFRIFDFREGSWVGLHRVEASL